MQRSDALSHDAAKNSVKNDDSLVVGRLSGALRPDKKYFCDAMQAQGPIEEVNEAV